METWYHALAAMTVFRYVNFKSATVWIVMAVGVNVLVLLHTKSFKLFWTCNQLLVFTTGDIKSQKHI